MPAACRGGGRAAGGGAGLKLRGTRVALAILAGGVILMAGWAVRSLPEEAAEPLVLVELRWDDPDLPLPGPEWVRKEGGIEPVTQGAGFRIDLSVPAGSAAWARVGAKHGVRAFLRDEGGRQRIARPTGDEPGPATVLRRPAPGTVMLLVTAEPGSRLYALEAGIVPEDRSAPVLPLLGLGVWAAAVFPLLLPLRRGPGLRRNLWLAALGLAAVLSLWMAWSRYAEVGLDGPEPDMAGFCHIASEMGHPYDSGRREPLWPLLIRLWWMVAPGTHQAVRLLGVLMAPLAVPAAAFLLRRVFASPVVALAGAWLVAGNFLLAHTACRGLRGALYVPLVAVAAGLAAGRGKRWRWAALGATGALLCLLRLESILLLAAILPVALWRGRPRWSWAAGGAAVFLVLMAPYLVMNQIEHGNAFQPLSRHSRGLAARLARAEGRSLDLETIHSGEEVGPGELFFERVGVIGTLGRWLRGWRLLALDPTSVQLRWLLGAPVWPWLIWIAWPLWIAGMLVWLFRPPRFGLLLLLGCAHIVPFLAAGVADPRYSAHLVPFYAGAMGLALVAAARAAGRLRAQRREAA